MILSIIAIILTVANIVWTYINYKEIRSVKELSENTSDSVEVMRERVEKLEGDIQFLANDNHWHRRMVNGIRRDLDKLQIWTYNALTPSGHPRHAAHIDTDFIPSGSHEEKKIRDSRIQVEEVEADNPAFGEWGLK